MARPQNTDERKEQIVEGLLTVLATAGLRGASTAAIAEAAGLTSGLVHYHFKTKADVWRAAVEALVDAHEGRVEVAIEAVDAPRSPLAARPSPAQARVDAWIEASSAVGGGDARAVACWVALAGESTSNPPLREALEAGFMRLARRLEALLTDASAERQTRARSAPDVTTRQTATPRALAAAMLAMIMGAFVLAATAKELAPAGYLAENLRLLVRGAGLCT